MRMPILAAGMILLASFLVLPSCANGQARTAWPSTNYAFGEHPVSPTAWASWFAETEDGTPREVALVVLWRGAPRWYSHIDGGTTGMHPPESTSEPLVSSFRFGDTELSLSFNPSTRVARLLGQEVVLGDDNVIFVDQVGHPGMSPEIVGTARIDLRLSPSGANPRGTPHRQISEILRHSPEVQAFLR